MANRLVDRKLYKKLVTDIAAELSDPDIRTLAYQNDIKNYSDALDLFTQLEKRGCIGRDKIAELEDVLTRINRKDLVTELKETISKNEGRKVQSMKLPESEQLHIGRRANTVSGVPLSTRIPQQESGTTMPSFNEHEQNTQTEFQSTSQPTEESGGPDGTDNETQLQHKVSTQTLPNGNSLRSEALDTSTLNHKKRSRHSSDRLTTQSQRTSRSGSRSPSVQHLSMASVSTSAYHSASDLSAASGGNIPQTESERNFILISRMLDVISSPSSKMSDSETLSESGDEHNTPQLMMSLEKVREKYQQQPAKRGSTSDSENTLERSQESGQDHRLSSGLEMSPTTHKAATRGASSPSPPPPRRHSRTRVSKLLAWKKSLQRSSSGDRQSLTWSVKRDHLNKPIFRHQGSCTIEWKRKVEVDVGNGSIYNPKLIFILHPYGLEEDRQKYVTLEIRIDVPKKAPKLKEATCVKLTLTVSETGGKTLKEHELTKNLNLRVFYQHKFVSHKAIRESHGDFIDITTQAECVVSGIKEASL